MARVAVAGVPEAHQELGEVGGGAVVAAVGGHDAVRGVRRPRGESRVNLNITCCIRTQNVVLGCENVCSYVSNPNR